MKILSNKKLIFMIIIAISFITLFNFKVYAEETAFSLDKESANVNLNGSCFLSYSGGTGTVTWESSDTSIATVENGTVKALKIGTVTITATRGTETDSCEINVVYSMLTIGGNAGKSVSTVNLILGEHDSEKLIAKVDDGNYKEVTNASVSWKSSDANIVSVDSTSGEIKAVKPGTATITATAAGVSDTCEVTVYEAPKFTDFSNAKYETSLNWDTETLKITGITPSDGLYNSYYYIITPDNKKPTIVKNKSGALDQEETSDFENLSKNTEENYMYTRKISKYAELNQDLYLWILQEEKLASYYFNESGDSIYYSTKFIVEGKKIERAELPQLNLILQTLNIGCWDGTTSEEKDSFTYIHFNFPTDTENRKFTLKIGKVTDSAILSKIQKNDYEGIKDLLTYAKSHDAIYSQELTTTNTAYFRSDNALFDGKKLLEKNAYYYIYAEFDDENGKYYPIEGVTLAQAWISSENNMWNLLGFTSSDFNWDNLTPSDSNSKDSDVKTTNDPTTAPDPIPQTGETVVILITAIILIVVSIISFKRFKHLRDVK